MGNSKFKRLLARLSILLLLAAAAIALYSYPRRRVPAMLRLVPREGLAVCVRARGLGPVWRRCARSEFGRKVGRGGIFPIDEMIAADKEARDAWEDIDTTYWPEALGRDCVLGVYAGEGERPLRAAVWARIGFRARLFHLWERTRGALCFRRAKRIRARRVGGLVVVSVMNRKQGTEDFSYTLLGDLGIATTGRGDGFWEGVAALAVGDAGAGKSAGGLIAEVPAPGGGKARGALFADVGALRGHADARLRAIAKASPETGRKYSAVWDPARAVIAGWKTATASFTLGERTEAEVRIERSGGEPARPLSAEPLEGLMAQRGILYAAGGWDPRGLLDRARRNWPRGQVRFEGRGGVTAFPAGHFSLGWLGEEWEFLLYLDGRGMLNAASSFQVRNRRAARERVARFLKLADGATIRFSDGRGGEWAPVEKPLDVQAVRGGKGLCYRIGPGAPIEYLYNPTLIVQNDRLVIASADPREEASPGGGPPAAGERAAPVTGKFILRGSAADRAASSLRQVLAVAGAFVGERRDRRRIEEARRVLGALEWLAPLREARALVAEEKGATRVSLTADIADVRAP